MTEDANRPPNNVTAASVWGREWKERVEEWAGGGEKRREGRRVGGGRGARKEGRGLGKP